MWRKEKRTCDLLVQPFFVYESNVERERETDRERESLCV